MTKLCFQSNFKGVSTRARSSLGGSEDEIVEDDYNVRKHFQESEMFQKYVVG